MSVSFYAAGPIRRIRVSLFETPNFHEGGASEVLEALGFPSDFGRMHGEASVLRFAEALALSRAHLPLTSTGGVWRRLEVLNEWLQKVAAEGATTITWG